jgi:L-threonylcarbamoyladenylate synthase
VTIVWRAVANIRIGGPDAGGPAKAPRTVAVRVPDLPDLCALIRAAGGALVSTSANRSGEAPATSLASAWRRWRCLVDGAWDPVGELQAARREASPAGSGPSAIVDLTGWPPRLIRRGVLAPPSWEDLL